MTTPDAADGGSVGPSRRCAVLGDPIAHSLSPVLHRAGYAHVGLPWSYDAHRVASGGLAAFVAGLDDSWRGLSLTMPLKREAVPLLDRISATGALAGAVNTVILDDGIAGDNTDVPGAQAALRERYDGPIRAATILGGGATATSCLLALAALGCRQVTLHVRDERRAAETLAASRRLQPAIDVRVAPLTAVPSGEVLVSTIPAVAQTPDLLAAAADVPVVFEVLYDPWPTPLAAAALASGQTLVGGLDLLVHQAALQFELFTGATVPVETLRTAGRAALTAAAG